MRGSTSMVLGVLVAVSCLATAGCGKKVDPEKTLKCAEKQPYKADADCKACCGGDYKLSDEVCLCYK